MTAIKILLDKAATLGYRYPRLVIGAFLVLTIAGGIAASQLRVATGANLLAPREMTNAFLEETAAWGQRRFLFLVFPIPKGIRVSVYEPYIRQVREKVRALALTKGVALHDLMLPRKTAKDFIVDKGLLLIDLPALKRFEQTLSPPAMRRKLRGVDDSGFGFFDLFTGKFGTRYDPLQLTRFVREHLPLSGLIRAAKEGDYLMTGDRKTVFLTFTLAQRIDDAAFSASLRPRIQQVAQEAWQSFIEKYPSRAVLPEIELKVMGPHLVFLEERARALQEFWLISLVALVGVVLLFLLFFREGRLMLFAGSAVLCGSVWTLGTAYLTIGNLNLATMSVAAVTLGLGIDFSVHLLSRYWQERKVGQHHDEALRCAWRNTGQGVVFSALTTTVIFYLLLFSSLEGFRQLGFLLGTGVIFTCVAALFLLPALLSVSKIARADYVFKDVSRFPLVGRWIEFAACRPVATLIASAILFVGALYSLTFLQFRFSEMAVHSDRSVSWKELSEFENRLGTSLMTAPLIIDAPNLERALKTEEELRRSLNQLLKEKTITAYTSLSQWLPRQESQRRNLEYLSQSQILSPEGFRRNYFSLLDLFEIQSKHLRVDYPEIILRPLHVKGPIDYDSLKEAGLHSLLEVHYRKTPQGVSLRSLVYLPQRSAGVDTHRAFLDRFKQEALYQEGRVRVLATVEIISRIEGLVKKDFIKIALIGFVGVFALCFVCLRRLGLAMIAMVPLCFGSVAMLGTFALTGKALDFVNMLWIPMIIGLGVDYGIHMLKRYQEGDVSIVEMNHRVGRAILVTTLTTMMSFSTFLLTSFPVSRSAGFLITFGMAWVLIASLFIIPSLLGLIGQKGAFDGPGITT